MLRKIKISDKTQALRQVPLFSGCSDEELLELARLATEVEVHDGQVICSLGEPGHEFCVVLDGTAVITRGDDSEVEIGAGAFFGELALLVEGGQRTATVTMTSPGQLLVMAGPEFRELLTTVPQIAVRMLAELGGRLHALSSPTH